MGERNKIINYLLIGGTAALIEWALFYLLDSGWGCNYLLAVVLSFLLATWYHYLLTIRFVFASGAKYKKTTEFSLVVAVSVVGLLFNLLLMYVFVGRGNLPALPSKMAASGIVVVWNYLARKWWIF